MGSLHLLRKHSSQIPAILSILQILSKVLIQREIAKPGTRPEGVGLQLAKRAKKKGHFWKETTHPVNPAHPV